MKGALIISLLTLGTAHAQPDLATTTTTTPMVTSNTTEQLMSRCVVKLPPKYGAVGGGTGDMKIYRMDGSLAMSGKCELEERP